MYVLCIMSRRLTEHAEFCHQRCNNNIYRATEEGDLDLYNRRGDTGVVRGQYFRTVVQYLYLFDT